MFRFAAAIVVALGAVSSACRAQDAHGMALERLAASDANVLTADTLARTTPREQAIAEAKVLLSTRLEFAAGSKARELLFECITRLRTPTGRIALTEPELVDLLVVGATDDSARTRITVLWHVWMIPPALRPRLFGPARQALHDPCPEVVMTALGVLQKEPGAWDDDSRAQVTKLWLSPELANPRMWREITERDALPRLFAESTLNRLSMDLRTTAAHALAVFEPDLESLVGAARQSDPDASLALGEALMGLIGFGSADSLNKVKAVLPGAWDIIEQAAVEMAHAPHQDALMGMFTYSYRLGNEREGVLKIFLRVEGALRAEKGSEFVDAIQRRMIATPVQP